MANAKKNLSRDDLRLDQLASEASSGTSCAGKALSTDAQREIAKKHMGKDLVKASPQTIMTAAKELLKDSSLDQGIKKQLEELVEDENFINKVGDDQFKGMKDAVLTGEGMQPFEQLVAIVDVLLKEWSRNQGKDKNGGSVVVGAAPGAAAPGAAGVAGGAPGVAGAAAPAAPGVAGAAGGGAPGAAAPAAATGGAPAGAAAVASSAANSQTAPNVLNPSPGASSDVGASSDASASAASASVGGPR
jgi:hypothetical protein